jgi:hypothetical protein
VRRGLVAVLLAARLRAEVRLEFVVRESPDPTAALALDATGVLFATEFAYRHVQTRSGLRLIINSLPRIAGLEPRNALTQFVYLIHGDAPLRIRKRTATFLPTPPSDYAHSNAQQSSHPILELRVTSHL